MTERLLTLAAVADALDCSVATVKRRIRNGRLPAFRDGRIVRVRESDLRRYIAGAIVATAEREEPRHLSLVASSTSRPRPGRLWD